MRSSTARRSKFSCGFLHPPPIPQPQLESASFIDYKGKPGDKDDPAQGKGMRLVPILSADKPALRAIIAEYIATKKPVKVGKGNESTIEKICSFAFKSNANTLHEPDGGVLDDLLRRVLPEGAPEIRGIITAPVMPHLPTSTAPKDLLRPDADYSSSQNQDSTPGPACSWHQSEQLSTYLQSQHQSK